ncbi:hypothetical protein BKA62DRAFT_687096 [Auriculariales sp. MPI-PUGE-AT-0066]|nr:hypothetical protein BKA62DRAFT_687096 [Auriculariales sp. MPI-PUGE-AT-0066]
MRKRGPRKAIELPFDVLSQIVLLCTTEPSVRTVDALTSLWTLSRGWRNAALQTPLAWACIELAPPHYCHVDRDSDEPEPSWRDHHGGLTTVRQVAGFLRLSSTCIKDVLIKDPSMSDEDIEWCFQLLKEHASTIRNLSIHIVPGWTTVQKDQLFVQGQQLPKLKRLALHLQTWPSIGDDFPLTPNLTHLVIYNPVVRDLPEHARQTIQHLTAFSRFSDTRPWIVRTLRPETYPALQSLSLVTGNRGVEADFLGIARPPLVNESLTALSFATSSALEDTLVLLRLPTLTRLAVACDWTVLHELSGTALLTFLAAPHTPPLRTLHLDSVTLSDENMVAILRLLPSLEMLAVSRIRLSDAVVRALVQPQPVDSETGTETDTEVGAWLCPHLTHFSYYARLRSEAEVASVVSASSVEDLALRRGLVDGGAQVDRNTVEGPAKLQDVRLHSRQLLGFQAGIAVWSAEDRFFSRPILSMFEDDITSRSGWWDFPMFTEIL